MAPTGQNHVLVPILSSSTGVEALKNTTVIRSTLWHSWPNKAGLNVYCLPRKILDFNEIWHASRGRWVMTWSKVEVTSPWKLEVLPFSKAISSALTMGAGNWPLIL